MRYYYVVRVNPKHWDYGQTDCLLCHPGEIGFLLRTLDASVLGEGWTKEEAFANSQRP